MAQSDAETLHFYAREAKTYATDTASQPTTDLDRFLDALKPGATILELGCGSGRDSAHMLARGFDVFPTDGTPEMALEAERTLGRAVAVLPFDQLDAVSQYDAVWANACLLHVPRPDLAGILSRIRRATRAAGLFQASYKAGAVDGRDRFDRYYNYPAADWLCAQYGAAGWADIRIETREGSGYDRQPTQWLHVTARRQG
ncbi:class I SAM-dependent methyltransferase [Pararhizobium antarcticum]|uniref:SAM-dependent methyltransferase n=1 Tax=Pararhizobium antarcticum TaxID=1798805 RepID=A0A657LZ19_9HYPH|nr:class I SAM-dependent methyltransferase [Pararhizobium antarcticum]OJF95153.1 SAM-dependent methyltransferase [Rhizobium sp. 58]OJG00762.1 SAM-dependent methyltransferase [Pararhizobium antarcticum]